MKRNPKRNRDLRKRPLKVHDAKRAYGERFLEAICIATASMKPSSMEDFTEATEYLMPFLVSLAFTGMGCSKFPEMKIIAASNAALDAIKSVCNLDDTTFNSNLDAEE